MIKLGKSAPPHSVGITDVNVTFSRYLVQWMNLCFFFIHPQLINRLNCRLKTILDVGDLDDILDSSLISGKNIMHNCSFVNKNGIVTCIEPKGESSFACFVF